MSTSRSPSRSPPPRRAPPTGPAAAAAAATVTSPSIDRQKTVPFLLNFCYRVNAFHNILSDFPIPGPSAHPSQKPSLPAHVEIYTWMDCTLRELAHLLVTALPILLGETAVGTRLAFRLVFPDMRSVTGPGGGGRGGGGFAEGRLDGGGEGRPRYMSREMGSVVISAPKEERDVGDGGQGVGGYDLGGEDADKTLDEARFVIGDFVDVAVFPPLSDGSVVSRGTALGAYGRGGRENGFSSRGVRGGGGGGGGGGGFGSGARGGRGDFGAPVPAGEWRRGERLPIDSGFRGGRGRPRY